MMKKYVFVIISVFAHELKVNENTFETIINLFSITRTLHYLDSHLPHVVQVKRGFTVINGKSKKFCVLESYITGIKVRYGKVKWVAHAITAVKHGDYIIHFHKIVSTDNY